MKKVKLLLGIMMITAGIISLSSCQSSKTAASGKMLKFNLEKGKGYDYEMVVDMDMKMEGQTSKVTVDGDYSMKIVDENAGVKTVATTYNSVKMSMNVMGMNIEMDSNKPVEGDVDMKKNPMGAMNKIMAGLINKPFMVKVNEEGDVLEVTGFDKIVSDMIDSLGLEEQQKEMAKASMKDQFNDQSMKDNFAQMFTIFPNKEVKVGDSWKKTHSTVGKMGAVYNTTYTVKDIDGDHVTLRTDTKINSDKEGAEIDGTQTGNIIVDSKTGLMINSEFDQNFKMKTDKMTMDIVGKGRIKGKAL
jgi:hypothetical protein